MKIRRMLSIVLSLMLLLSGCSRSSKTFVGYDISAGTNNLDPQFYEDKTAEMLVMNLYEGLVVRDSGGEIHPGAADSFAVSEDGLTYDFTLRQDAFWPIKKDQKSSKITSADFQFAFFRLFSPEAPSPHSENYLAIENSKKILSGSLPLDQLGIELVDENHLIIRLEYPDPMFLEKLSLPPAMPCNEKFFLSTRGRYGLEKELVLGNGPFELVRWEKENRITLDKNSNYQGETPVKLETVDFYIGRQDVRSRFEDSKTHLMKLESDQLDEAYLKSHTIKSYDGVVWCVAFNLDSNYWSNPMLRQAVTYATDRSVFEDQTFSARNQKSFVPTDSVFTKEIRAGGYSLVDYKPEELPRPAYDLEKARESYSFGLSTLGIERIPSASIYVPEGGAHEEMLRPLQNKWQEALSLYISLNELPQNELELLVKSKDYDMILLPLRSSSHRPNGVLDQFESTSRLNYTNYKNEAYDLLLPTIEQMKTGELMADKARMGEQFLLLDSVVIPVYTEQIHFAVAAFADEIDIYPMENVVRFHQAQTNVAQS